MADSRTLRIYKAHFGNIEVKFVGLQRGMGFERNFYFKTVKTSTGSLYFVTVADIDADSYVYYPK